MQGCATNSKKSKSLEAAGYHAQLGIGYLQRNRLKLAQQYLGKALAANPKSPTVQHYYALLQDRIGNKQLAARYFALAVKQDRNNPELLNNYGSFLCKHGAVNRAEMAFLRATANPLYDTPEFAFTNAGICLKKRNNYRRAEGYLSKALSLNPTFPSALYHMAELSHRQNKNAKAQAYLYRYNERAPITSETLKLCYRISTALNEVASAQKCSAQLLANFPNSKEASELN